MKIIEEQKMRVLFTTNIPSPYRVDFFNELGKYCELTVLFETKADKSRDKNWVADTISTFNAVFMKGIKKGEAEAFCPEIIKYLSLKKFDVIVIGAYHTPSGMLATQYMKMLNIPFILSSDGGMKKEESGIKYKLKAHFISAASAWLSTGKVTNEYLEYYGARRDKIYVYPFTSVRESDILKKTLTVDEKRTIRTNLNIAEEKMILSVGQFIYRKGYDILLKACEGLDNSIGLYIVGGKPTEEYLRIQKEMNLTNVHFVDFMNKRELREYYKAADMFVLPTREDIWGLVINEAMAYGLPVITTNKCVAGVEMIKDGINGMIVSCNEFSNLSFVSILKDNAMNDLCKNNLKQAKKYSIENMAKTHIGYFKTFKKGICYWNLRNH